MSSFFLSSVFDKDLEDTVFKHYYHNSRRYNVEDADGVRTLELELPGVKKEDVQVTAEDNRLYVHWKHKDKYYSTNMALQNNTGDIEATLENGVLVVKAKSKESQVRKILLK